MKILRKIILLIAALAVCIAVCIAVYNFYPEPAIGKKINKIIVFKSERRMQVFHNDELLKSYSISLGPQPAGHKQQEGDGRTPEGKYRISAKNDKSKYHRSLAISYPNEKDKAGAKARGASPGGSIMIHGLKYGFLGKLHRWTDWTQGCIAVTDKEIDEIYEHIDTGTEVEIKP
jgi:murein L,D-transpeptidase YafK